MEDVGLAVEEEAGVDDDAGFEVVEDTLPEEVVAGLVVAEAALLLETTLTDDELTDETEELETLEVTATDDELSETELVLAMLDTEEDGLTPTQEASLEVRIVTGEEYCRAPVASLIWKVIEVPDARLACHV